MLNRMAYTALFTALALMIGVLLYWRVEIISLGGPVMIPIVMCSVFSLAIVFERGWYFFQLHMGKDIEAFFDRLRATVEKHLRWLSTLAQVSTLLGLLGTVTGLVRAFQVIQRKSGASGTAVNPGDLAGGVWEALITTVAGLVIAIPTILAYNYFAARLGEVQFHMEKAAGIISSWRHRRGTASCD